MPPLLTSEKVKGKNCVEGLKLCHMILTVPWMIGTAYGVL